MKTPRLAHTAQNNSPEPTTRTFIARHFALGAALLIIIAGGAVCANSLRVGFLWDDLGNIVSNPALRHFPSLARTLQDPRPVVLETLALNRAWSGSDPWSYHLVNVAVHLLAALALFGIVRRTLELPALAARYGPWAAPLALATALLWMVHPLQTESVTYVIQRSESLMGLFYLLALYCLIRGHGSPHPRRWCAGAVASSLLGAGCKEVIVTLPVVALAYDALFLTGSWRESLRRRWGLYLGLILCCGLAVCRFMRHSADEFSTAGFEMKNVTPLQYALTQPGVILHYLRLSFLPWPLCLDYRWPLIRSVGDALPALLGIGALLGVSLWGLVCGRRWGFLGLAFFCILAPTSSIVPLRDAAFEHRMYLPLAAVTAGVVIAGVSCWNRAWPLSSGRWSGRALAGAGILAVAGLSFLTVRRNADYQDELRLWKQTARCSPRPSRAWLNLGLAYLKPGNMDEAFRCFDKSLEAEPGYPPTLYSRGLACAKTGRADEALRDLTEAIAHKPNFAEAYVARGAVHAAAGHDAEAIGDYDQAIALKPGLAEAWFNRGKARARIGRPEEALRDLGRAIALYPDYAEAYVARGAIYAAAGHDAEAVGDYDQAIALDPDDARSWFNRGDACAKTGRSEEALRDLDRAIRLKPDFAEAYCSRGNIFLDAKRYAEAIHEYDQAIACNPRYADAWYDRADAYAAADRPEEAIRDFSRVIELQPQDPDAWYNRAIARSRMKQDREALEDFRMVRKLGGTLPEEILRSLGSAAGPTR